MACQCRGWEKGKSRGAGATGKGRSRARPSLARTGGLTSDASLADPSSSEIRLTLILAFITGARRLRPRQNRGVFSDDSQKTPVKFHDERTARAGYRPPRVARSAVVVTSAPLDDQPAKLATSEGRILRRSPRDLSVCPDDRLPAPETGTKKRKTRS